MKNAKPSRSGDARRYTSSSIVIDGRFFRDTARDALIQFFVPLTAAFTVKQSHEVKRRRGG